MPTPITSQAAAKVAGPEATERSAKPAANTRLVAASTSRPPLRSITRPASGPSRLESNRAAEKAPKNQVRDRCRLAHTGSANTAGR